MCAESVPERQEDPTPLKVPDAEARVFTNLLNGDVASAT